MDLAERRHMHNRNRIQHGQMFLFYFKIVTYLCGAFLRENEAVHVSHSNHIKHRAPFLLQDTCDQCLEIQP